MAAYQSLYRRYRSQTFDEVLGQPHVTTALKSAIAEGRQGHAYLFSGPRGTGKTSTARVLAKALNCENLNGGEPCGTCESCISIETGKSFDLHELDAASHNKVDDIRDLISKVQLGSPGRTKVYILDEVHMLSSGAENALLKTLEEPPDHVVFVLATTEPQKVVPTIRSRTQHYEFRLLPADVLGDHVRNVIQQANLNVGEDAIDYVLRQGGGSARDTLSALDLVAAAGGVPEGDEIAADVIRAIAGQDAGLTIATIQRGLEIGREPRTIGEDTLDLLRNAFLSAMGAPLTHLNDKAQELSAELSAALSPALITQSLEALGAALVEMRQAPDPRVPLEVTLLRLARPALDKSLAALTTRVEQLEQKVEALAAGTPTPVTPADPTASQPVPAPSHSSQPPAPPSAPQGQAPQPPRAAADAATGRPAPPSPRSPRPPRRAGSNGAPARNQSQQHQQAKAGPNRQNTDTDSSPPPDQQPTTHNSGPASADPPATPSPTPTQTGGPLTVDLVSATLERKLADVGQKVRVRFRGGRVLGVNGSVVAFGVPNAIHANRCTDVKDEIEKALSAELGQSISVDVVVDGDSVAPVDIAKIEPSAPARRPSNEPEDVGPVHELKDADDQASTTVDRLTQAFPGSTVIDSE